MAFAGLFPTVFINCQDFRVSRQTPSTSWGDDTTAVSIMGPAQAIVIQSSELSRGKDNEQYAVLADIYLKPNTTGATLIREKDRASFTLTPGGAFTNEEILSVDNWSGVDGLEHVKVRVIRRGAAAGI